MSDRFTVLFDQFLANSLSGEELREFMAMAREGEYDALIQQVLQDKLESGAYSGLSGSTDLEQKFSEMLARAQAMEAPVVPIHKTFTWRKFAVAASIVVLLGVGCWVLGLYLMNGKSTVDGPQTTAATNKDVKAPETNRAVIQLADGRLIYLDSAGAGELVQQAGVSVVKSGDGKLVYQTTDDSPRFTETVYNTITNPRGSRVIDMTLSDGSHVWLNAGSSLTYPVVFAGNERKVSITGEAYFEVAHNTAMPFYVSKGDLEVRVLGTHFNVNAYEDEEAVKVTLLEGSVEVKSQNSKVKIEPGEQASINADNGQLTTDNRINLEEVIAWKEGYFHFESADMRTILKEFGRWYDISVEYQGRVSDRRFFGIVKRSNSLNKVLEMLKGNNIKFEVNGKQLIVKGE